jgi:hypothetical protein
MSGALMPHSIIDSSLFGIIDALHHLGPDDPPLLMIGVAFFT